MKFINFDDIVSKNENNYILIKNIYPSTPLQLLYYRKFGM